MSVYRLGEDGGLHFNEGDGMLLVWTLRARSYKTRAEAYQQGIALHPLQGVFLVFVLHPEIGSRSSKVQKISVLSVQSVVVKEPVLWRTALQAAFMEGCLFPRALPPVTIW